MSTSARLCHSVDRYLLLVSISFATVNGSSLFLAQASSTAVRSAGCDQGAIGILQRGILALSVKGDTASVLAMLDDGGEVNARSSYAGECWTPLLAAAINGHDTLVDKLLQRGALVDLQNDIGATALHVAAIHGHDHVVDRLLRGGANVNHENEDGGTALMGAAYHGRASVVRRLLRADADAGMRDWQGDTALKLAQRQGHTACVESLKEHVAAEMGDASSGEAATHASNAGGELSGYTCSRRS